MHPMLTMKEWAHHMHMPTIHSIHDHTAHLLHDGRFWAIVGVIVLLGFLVLMAFMRQEGVGPEIQYPFFNFPYPYLPD